MSLTDAERRGARWLAVLLVIGILTDLHRARHTREAAEPAPPAVGESAPPAPSAAPAETSRSTPASPPTIVDLNRATLADLDRLPGIGPVLARRIVEHRDRHGAFRTVDELLGVPGIGDRLLARLRPFVRVTSR
jgi:competence protein ComEA